MRPSDMGGGTSDEPRWDPQDRPPGYGEAKPPEGGFSVQAQDLVTAAGVWDDLAKALKQSWSKLQEGWGYPTLFGPQDTLYTSGRFHEQVNEVLVNACADGFNVVSALADGLREAANDYSNTDDVEGQNFRTLERRVGE